ncbi:hypothetical protein BT69DRAFT_1347502 [Atractiella rhizophila]|nr:hypothetical protein BT69DRAFT_1347502 [Atractiella rhizophila]
MSAMSPSNSTNAAQVLCAFPLSGQYGALQRLLYYCLLGLCIFGRKNDWLRSACLGGTLVYAAVASTHGIVLAITRADGAVDMDIYGAFQVAAAAVLAAPMMLRYSSTYFNLPGRNIIFVWTVINLAGLLSLVYNFYKAHATDCLSPTGGIITESAFQYYTMDCSLQCEAKHSSLRVDANNNIYVIRAPSRGLTLDSATLLCASCCIPARP